MSIRKVVIALAMATGLALGTGIGVAVASGVTPQTPPAAPTYYCVKVGSMGWGNNGAPPSNNPSGYVEWRNVPKPCSSGHVLTPYFAPPSGTTGTTG